jgi:hypothetical protein
MSRFFDAIKTLFPQSRAFHLFVDNKKYKLVKALSALPEDVRHEAELVYMDLFPDSTRFPERWEKIFAVLFTREEILKRRNILASLWRISGGGGAATFIQSILQIIDDRIVVSENAPVTDPRTMLSIRVAVCGNRTMRCGNARARCNYHITNGSFVPSMLRNDVIEFYSLPADEAYWAFCFFVCGDVIRNGAGEIIHIQKLSIDVVWKNYIEYLILKIKPVHSTAIVFIDWQEVSP